MNLPIKPLENTYFSLPAMRDILPQINVILSKNWFKSLELASEVMSSQSAERDVNPCQETFINCRYEQKNNILHFETKKRFILKNIDFYLQSKDKSWPQKYLFRRNKQFRSGRYFIEFLPLVDPAAFTEELQKIEARPGQYNQRIRYISNKIIEKYTVGFKVFLYQIKTFKSYYIRVNRTYRCGYTYSKTRESIISLIGAVNTNE